MAVTAKWFGKGVENVARGRIDFDNDTIKVMLTTSSYTPNQDTHQTKSDVTNEVSGTGYTARGVALANTALTYDTATNKLTFDADDASWNPSSITNARYAVIYKDSGSDATSYLMGYVDFETDRTSDAAEFRITWHASGIFTITAS